MSSSSNPPTASSIAACMAGERVVFGRSASISGSGFLSDNKKRTRPPGSCPMWTPFGSWASVVSICPAFYQERARSGNRGIACNSPKGAARIGAMLLNGLGDRAEAIDRLGRERFDVAIVGGGITGAGIALDLAARGQRVGLVEQG